MVFVQILMISGCKSWKYMILSHKLIVDRFWKGKESMIRMKRAQKKRSRVMKEKGDFMALVQQKQIAEKV